MVDFGLDQFLHRDFIAVFEFAGIELRRSLGDESFGQLKGVFIDFRFFDIAEIVFLIPQFILIAQRIPHHAAAAFCGLDGNNVFATRKGNLPDGDLTFFRKRFADNGISLRLAIIFWNNKVGLFDVFRVFFARIDELEKSR